MTIKNSQPLNFIHILAFLENHDLLVRLVCTRDHRDALAAKSGITAIKAAQLASTLSHFFKNKSLLS